MPKKDKLNTGIIILSLFLIFLGLFLLFSGESTNKKSCTLFGYELKSFFGLLSPFCQVNKVTAFAVGTLKQIVGLISLVAGIILILRWNI